MRIHNGFVSHLLALGFVATIAAPLSASPLLARSSSFSRYLENSGEYWTGALKNQSGVTLTVLAVGAVALFIITRGKWQK